MSSPLRQHDPHTLLVIPENRLAVSAIAKLKPKSRNAPLVTLVGDAGQGKSKLAREVLREWQGQSGKRVCLTASELAAQVAEASEAQSMLQFQSRLRKDVSLLVCEDIQSLGPRKETQQQLLAAIDEIMANQGKVLLTSTRMPGEIKGLSKRLRNRMHGGLCVAIEPPSRESRRQMLLHFLSSESLVLSPEGIDLIADSEAASPRELLAVLTHLRVHASPRGIPLPKVELVLREISTRPPVSLGEIAKATAKVFQVKVAELKSTARTQTIANARHAAMFLGREVGKLNYAEIGEYFNRRNHSTVIHACQRIAQLASDDPKVARDLALIRQRLAYH